MTRIRRLTGDDLDSLFGFYTGLSAAVRELFQPFNPCTRVALERHLRGAEAGSVVSAGLTAGCRIVGHGFVSAVRERYPVLALGLREDYQHRGYGRELLRFVLNEAFAVGAACITLTVVKTNSPALRLYKSFGFNVVSEHSWKTHGDSYVMRLDRKNPRSYQ